MLEVCDQLVDDDGNATSTARRFRVRDQSTCAEVGHGFTKDENCDDGFQWTLALVANVVICIIIEVATTVTKATNASAKKSMVHAISCAPRGKRADWMLKIVIGTQSISPLDWSLETGASESLSVMIHDFLAFWSSREKDYYAAEHLSMCHLSIMEMLLNDALVWTPDFLMG